MSDKRDRKLFTKIKKKRETKELSSTKKKYLDFLRNKYNG